MALPRDPRRDHSRPLTEIRFEVAPAERGERLDRYLARQLFWRSRTSVQRLIGQGRVRLERAGSLGPPCTRSAHRLQPPLRVVLEIERPHHPATPAAEIPDLHIVHEDRWLVLIDKPAPLTVHPTGRHQEGTLIQLLHRRYRRPEDPANDIIPKLAHRLDRETSGLVLVSKDDDVRHHLGILFEQRAIEKHYLALVAGRPERSQGFIDLALAPARDSLVRVRMEARRDGRGLHALTHYRVLSSANGCSLLAVHPRTGRQHQIRVHLAAIGHAIIGDKIYGPDEQLFLKHLEGGLSSAEEALLGMPRHALHSWRLRFLHPKRGVMVAFSCPLPHDMAEYLRRAR